MSERHARNCGECVPGGRTAGDCCEGGAESVPSIVEADDLHVARHHSSASDGRMAPSASWSFASIGRMTSCAVARVPTSWLGRDDGLDVAV